MAKRAGWPVLMIIASLAAGLGILATRGAAVSSAGDKRITPAQTEPGRFEILGVHLEASAYFEKQYRDSSRYAVRILDTPPNSHFWELYGKDGFYFDRDEPKDNQSYGGIAQTPYA